MKLGAVLEKLAAVQDLYVGHPISIVWCIHSAAGVCVFTLPKLRLETSEHTTKRKPVSLPSL